MDILEIKNLRQLNLEEVLDKEEGYHEHDFFFWAEGEKEATLTVCAEYENHFEYDNIHDQHRYTQTDFHSVKVFDNQGDEITLDEEAEEELTKIILEKS